MNDKYLHTYNLLTENRQLYNDTPLTEKDVNLLWKLSIKTDNLLVRLLSNDKSLNIKKRKLIGVSNEKYWGVQWSTDNYTAERHYGIMVTAKSEISDSNKINILKRISPKMKKYGWILDKNNVDGGRSANDSFLLYDKNKKILMSLIWRESDPNFHSFEYSIFCSNQNELSKFNIP